MENYYWSALGAAKGIGTARLLALVKAFGSAQNLYEAEEADILATGIVSEKALRSLRNAERTTGTFPEKLREQCERLGISVVPVTGPEYPKG